MSETIVEVTGYKTSRDYELLERLMREQSVVCIVEKDADFIAASRTDVPRLVEWLEEAMEVLKNIRDAEHGPASRYAALSIDRLNQRATEILKGV